MSPEDFRSIIREEIATAEQRIIGRQDSAIETIAGELSRVREEFTARFTEIDRRLDRLTEQTRLVQVALTGLNQWADRLDKDQATLGQNYFRQQRAIEQLAARVEALERKPPGQ